MSIAAMNWAYEQPITGWAKPILVMLADHADQNHEAWPSIARQACRVGCSERTVQIGLRELEAGGYIQAEVGGGRGRGHVSCYRLQVKPRQCAPERVQEIHPSTPKGAAPAPIKGAAPAPFSDEKGADRVGKGADSARKGAAPAPEPLRTLKEPKKAGFENSPVGKEERTAPLPEPEREPTPAEIEANRRRQLEEIANMPTALADAVRRLANAVEHRYHGPGRWPERTPEAQADAVAPPRIRPSHLSGDALAAFRARACRGMALPVRAVA